jgi:hypothetical protein
VVKSADGSAVFSVPGFPALGRPYLAESHKNKGVESPNSYAFLRFERFWRMSDFQTGTIS